jgi:hypothetical protein
MSLSKKLFNIKQLQSLFRCVRNLICIEIGNNSPNFSIFESKIFHNEPNQKKYRTAFHFNLIFFV